MNKKLYTVWFYSSISIREIEIVKETEKCYWREPGYRELKDSIGKKTFQSLKEAEEFAIQEIEDRIESNLRNIEYNKKENTKLEEQLTQLRGK